MDTEAGSGTGGGGASRSLQPATSQNMMFNIGEISHVLHIPTPSNSYYTFLICIYYLSLSMDDVSAFGPMLFSPAGQAALAGDRRALQHVQVAMAAQNSIAKAVLIQLCAFAVVVAAGLLLYWNYTLLRPFALPLVWAQLVSVALWPIKQGMVQQMRKASQSRKEMVKLVALPLWKLWAWTQPLIRPLAAWIANRTAALAAPMVWRSGPRVQQGVQLVARWLGFANTLNKFMRAYPAYSPAHTGSSPVPRHARGTSAGRSGFSLPAVTPDRDSIYAPLSAQRTREESFDELHERIETMNELYEELELSTFKGMRAAVWAILAALLLFHAVSRYAVGMVVGAVSLMILDRVWSGVSDAGGAVMKRLTSPLPMSAASCATPARTVKLPRRPSEARHDDSAACRTPPPDSLWLDRPAPSAALHCCTALCVIFAAVTGSLLTAGLLTERCVSEGSMLLELTRSSVNRSAVYAANVAGPWIRTRVCPAVSMAGIEPASPWKPMVGHLCPGNTSGLHDIDWRIVGRQSADAALVALGHQFPQETGWIRAAWTSIAHLQAMQSASQSSQAALPTQRDSSHGEALNISGAALAPSASPAAVPAPSSAPPSAGNRIVAPSASPLPRNPACDKLVADFEATQLEKAPDSAAWRRYLPAVALLPRHWSAALQPSCWQQLARAAKHSGRARGAQAGTALRHDTGLSLSAIAHAAAAPAARLMTQAAGTLQMVAEFAAVAASRTLQFIWSAVLFVTVLAYLLAAKTDWLTDVSQALTYTGKESSAGAARSRAGGASGTERLGSASASSAHKTAEDVAMKQLRQSFQAVFVLQAEILAYRALYTWAILTLFGAPLVYITTALTAAGAVFPVLSVLLMPLPAAAAQLATGAWSWPMATALWVVHGVWLWFAESYLYEGERQCHPLLIGIAIVAGSYEFGVQGVIFGPLILSMGIASWRILLLYLHQYRRDAAYINKRGASSSRRAGEPSRGFPWTTERAHRAGLPSELRYNPSATASARRPPMPSVPGFGDILEQSVPAPHSLLAEMLAASSHEED